MFKKILFLAITFCCGVFSAFPQAVLFNPAAPEGLDQNLAVGENALAIDQHWNISRVTIISKAAGTYTVAPQGTTEWELKNRKGILKTYKANSIQKDFDIGGFFNAARPYKRYIEPYLECYAAAFKFPSSYVTGKKEWGKYYIRDIAEYDEQMAKLGELWALIQAKYPNIPNTFAPYDKNPVVWASIAKNREPMIQCIGRNPNDENIKLALNEIAAAKRMVAAYDGSNDLYSGSALDWIWRAISAKKREEYYTQRKDLKDFEALALKIGKDPNELIGRLNKEFDDLKALAGPKLPSYKIKEWYFKYQDAAAQAKMKAFLKNPGSLKIYKTGVSDAAWQIEKNSIGIPLYRYKRGQMLVRNSSDDHPFCKGLFFVVKQTYSGGGGYGASEISSYHEELYGCP